MQDFAHRMRCLVNEAYPDVPLVRVVLDNLNTHRTASLYETFPAAGVPPHSQARELAESCPEPDEGMAETELSVLARACLKGRNSDEYALKRNICACEAERNAMGATINWRFTAKDARTKFHRLYPDTSALTQHWGRFCASSAGVVWPETTP